MELSLLWLRTIKVCSDWQESKSNVYHPAHQEPYLWTPEDYYLESTNGHSRASLNT